MPFESEIYRQIFSSEELEQVRMSYVRCCDLLGTWPNTHESEILLAQFVLRAFEESNHDPELTALRAFEIVQMLH